MAALTVFLAPPGRADCVLSTLTDLSAAGLIEPFHWVSSPSETTSPTSLLRVAGGEHSDVTIQQIVSGQVVDFTRVCVLVPLTGPDTALTLEQERFTADLLAATTGGRHTVRVRCLLALPGEGSAAGAHAAVEGWHNIVVSPEDGRGPAMGHIQLPPGLSAAQLGRHAAPVAAGLLGLWSNVEHRPIDNAPVPPGSVVRLARSYYRKVETADAEAALRRQLLAQDGRLPLPVDQRSPVQYVHDVSLATATMADQLWHKHSAVLKGSRREPERRTVEQIGAWKALKMFFSFLWAAIKNAPSAWYQRMVDGVSTGIAAGVNRAVFGQNSAFEVVVNGRTPRGDRAEWSDIADATGQLTSALGNDGDGRSHNDRVDLSAVWQDYARSAMTLADAGVRSGDLPPVQIGPNRGIVAQAADIVPGPAQRFNEIPGVIAASIEHDGVDSTDPLGIAALRYKLGDLERTPEHGLQARTTLNALDAWQRQQGQSFGVAVGRRLADAFTSIYGEVRDLLGKLQNAPEPPPEPGRNNALARWIQVTVVLLVIATAALGFLAYRDLLKWWWAVPAGVALYLLGFGLCARAFWRSQQELFQLLNQRRSVLSQREVDEQNLRTALRDLRRLSQAYGEYLCWSRALGSYLAAPLGPNRIESEAVLRLSWGLPMSTAVGYAAPGEADIDTMVSYLRRDLFGQGWLTAGWDDLVLGADPPPPGTHDVVVDNAAVWTQAGRGSLSLLDQWSEELFTGQRTATGADVAWDRARGALRGPMAQLADSLINHVELPGSAPMDRQQFLAGIDARADGGANLDGSLLTDLATTYGAGKVVDDIRTTVPDGLGLICVATQISDGLESDSLKSVAAAGQPAAGWTQPVPRPAFEEAGSAATPVPDHLQQFRPPRLGGDFNF